MYLCYWSRLLILCLQCPIEWFHYGCVGLTQAPKGKWFCPQCTAAIKRRGRRNWSLCNTTDSMTSVCVIRGIYTWTCFFMCSNKQGGTSCIDKWKWMCSHGSQFLDCGDMYSVCVFDGIQFLVCEYTYSVFGLLAFHYWRKNDRGST